jgi:hypothetical protein
MSLHVLPAPAQGAPLRRLVLALLPMFLLAATAQAQSPAPRDAGRPPADGAPTLAAPADPSALGSGTPRHDHGGAAAARTGPETTDQTRLPPAGTQAPPGQGVTPGANPALGRGS